MDQNEQNIVAYLDLHTSVIKENISPSKTTMERTYNCCFGSELFSDIFCIHVLPMYYVKLPSNEEIKNLQMIYAYYFSRLCV